MASLDDDTIDEIVDSVKKYLLKAKEMNCNSFDISVNSDYSGRIEVTFTPEMIRFLYFGG